MIYSNTTISRRVAAGELGIAPFYPDRLGPASYDVALGRRVLTFTMQSTWRRRLLSRLRLGPVHDIQDKPDMVAHEMGPEGMILWPGQAYLLSTEEVFTLPWDVAGVIDGKSGIGRLFVKVHETAGNIAPGFTGRVTLEVTTMLPIRIYPGLRFGQVRFHPLTEPVTPPEVSKPPRDHSEGPVASYFWETLREKPDPFGAVMVIPRGTEDGGVEFLAVSRPHGGPDNLSMPGGKVDPGEEGWQAARREVFEETGIKVVATSFLGTTQVVPGENIAFYLALSIEEGEARQMEEKTLVKWVPYQALTRPSCTFAATYRDWLPAMLPPGIREAAGI